MANTAFVGVVSTWGGFVETLDAHPTGALWFLLILVVVLYHRRNGKN
jgi:succinate dehydrogenase hydrophobic anchor subunit